MTDELQGKKILIVDDDARNIFALRAVLKSRGYDCATASTAREGLQRLATGGVAVILLDMMMPEMDGYEMLSLIRSSEHQRVPVIAVTAQAMVGDREKCLDAGADAYVSKPIDVDKLVLILEELCA